MNFLDVTLDLTTGKYKPYNKPGNIPLYINVKSSHPPNITKNLPESISRCINELSFDRSVFENSKDLYNNALSSSGFKDKIKFDPDFNRNISRSKNRKRKIICFNPPYSSNISTNNGKSFLTILDRHFLKSHKLYKIFNWNNVKISYSSMPNFASIINSHNKKIINNNIPKPSAPTCNCRWKISCPLNRCRIFCIKDLVGWKITSMKGYFIAGPFLYHFLILQQKKYSDCHLIFFNL